MEEKYVAAKAKVMEVKENNAYVIGFRCPDCQSGYVTADYSNTAKLNVGDIIDVKINGITKDQTLKIQFLYEKPDAGWMPDIMALARELGIVVEQKEEKPIVPVDAKQEEQDEQLAHWTRAFINDLPNSSFAYVEPCYGKTTEDKNARHLPYKDAGGKIDLPHLRNALARVNQIKPICSDTNKDAAISHARSELEKAAKSAGIGQYRVRESFGNRVYRILDTFDGGTFIGLSKIDMEVDTLADRDTFDRIAEEHQMADFTLIKHWWGQDGQYRHWDLFIDGKEHFVLEKDPLSETEMRVIQREPYSEEFWLRGEKLETIAPNNPGNPSKNMECSIQQIDKGKVAIYEDAQQADGAWLKRVEFFGSKIEGRWSLTSDISRVWHALKETTQLSEQNPLDSDILLSGEIRAWEETPDGLKVHGRALSFGVWNGFYWPPEVIEKSPLNEFDNMIIDVEHDTSKVAGVILKKEVKGPDVNVDFIVHDYETMEKIKNGEYKGLSIDAKVSADPVRRVVTGIKRYTRLTVCKNPACKVCYIGATNCE